MMSPTDLVAKASQPAVRQTWIDKLPTSQKTYIHDVVIAMLGSSDSTTHSVAVALKNELKLTAGVSTIRDTLRKLCDEKEKS